MSWNDITIKISNNLFTFDEGYLTISDLLEKYVQQFNRSIIDDKTEEQKGKDSYMDISDKMNVIKDAVCDRNLLKVWIRRFMDFW